MNIPIFCVNLERATERKELITKKWIDELGLDITFWKAYDRRDIDNNKFIYPYHKELTVKFMGRELNNGEIACATSFCMLYEHILENNYEEVIIMEDDIIPLINNKIEMFSTIGAGKIEFPSSELILLHRPHKPHQITVKKQYTSLCQICHWGNQLFYVNKTGLQKIYSILKNMYYVADYPQKSICKDETVIASNKGLCDHNWNGINATTYIGRNKRRNFIK
jgi:hypothetical protein